MKKTKLNKKAKKKSPAWWRKKCVEMAKLIAKHRGGYQCVSCPRNASQGFQIHGSHILPESKYHRLSCLPDNIMCQCAQCHMDWHENPLKSKDWFEKRFPGKKYYLEQMDISFSEEITKPDYEQIYLELKDEYQHLING